MLMKDQMRNHRNFNHHHHPLISHPSENFATLNYHGGSLLYVPPPHPSLLSHSFPPSVQYYHNRQQPPLLPLPIQIPNQQNFNSSRARGVSCPPVNQKIKNKNNPGQRKPKANTKKNNSVDVVDSSAAKQPTSQPSSRVLLSNNNYNDNDNNSGKKVVIKKQVVDFSGSVVYTDISPPPSSLPLPTFFLRPKLSCNVEAATRVDDGATNDLRRLLRLR